MEQTYYFLLFGKLQQNIILYQGFVKIEDCKSANYQYINKFTKLIILFGPLWKITSYNLNSCFSISSQSWINSHLDLTLIVEWFETFQFPKRQIKLFQSICYNRWQHKIAHSSEISPAGQLDGKQKFFFIPTWVQVF